MVQWREHGEDGEVRREAGSWRIPAPVSSPLHGTVLHLVLAQRKQSSHHNLFPSSGYPLLLPCRAGTLRVALRNDHPGPAHAVSTTLVIWDRRMRLAEHFNPWSYLPVSRASCTSNAKFFIFKNIASWFP